MSVERRSCFARESEASSRRAPVAMTQIVYDVTRLRSLIGRRTGRGPLTKDEITFRVELMNPHLRSVFSSNQQFQTSDIK